MEVSCQSKTWRHSVSFYSSQDHRGHHLEIETFIDPFGKLVMAAISLDGEPMTCWIPGPPALAAASSKPREGE